MTMIKYRSLGVDSGITTGFYLGNPYFERDVFERVFPPEAINCHPGEEVAEYYGMTHTHNLGPGPTWSQVTAILDYLEGQE